jgi:hypothetical protein
MGNAIYEAARGDRPRVRVAGTVRVIRRDRIGGMPAFEAELREGPDRVDLVWLGRANIPGIKPGSTVAAEGRLTARRGRTTMFNPRYELGAVAAGARGSLLHQLSAGPAARPWAL